jgi:hypothetical protein
VSVRERLTLPSAVSFPIILLIEITDLGFSWIPVFGPAVNSALDIIALSINFFSVGAFALIGLFEFLDVMPMGTVTEMMFSRVFDVIEFVPFHLIGFIIGKWVRRS